MKAKKEAVERERENAIRKAMLFGESLHPMGKEKKRKTFMKKGSA